MLQHIFRVYQDLQVSGVWSYRKLLNIRMYFQISWIFWHRHHNLHDMNALLHISERFFDLSCLKKS